MDNKTELNTFGYDYWKEHPRFPVTDWQYQVSCDYTRRGYWEWVEAKLLESDEEAAGQQEAQTGQSEDTKAEGAATG